MSRVLRPYRRDGIARNRVRSLLDRAVRRFRRVARRSLRPVRQDAPYWKLYARRRGRLLASRVGRVLLDRRTRWRAGARAIRRAVRRMRGNFSTDDIRARIRRFRSRYRYRQLSVDFERSGNQFSIEGSMSPGQTIMKVVPPTPPTRVRYWYNAGLPSMHVDPLSAKGRRGSPTSSAVSPRSFNSVAAIRSRGGTRSLYVKGHLLWAGSHGSGLDPDNLTWITRSLNARMFFRFELRLLTGLRVRPKRLRKVFSYRVESRPGAKPRPRRRCINGNLIRIPDERRLARALHLSLIEKEYIPSSRRWQDKRVVNERTEPNVPPYPRGFGESPNACV